MIPALRLARFLTAVVLAGVAACASKPQATTIQGALNVQASVNPDIRGRPSPIVVRVYALKSLTAFNGAAFFSLYEKDKETLGAELVDSEEFQLSPGEKRQFKKEVLPDVRYLGVFAAFRDVEHAQWRAAIPVAPNKVFPVQIELENTSATIVAGK
jgi:type VI secretion system protein VasD